MTQLGKLKEEKLKAFIFQKMGFGTWHWDVVNNILTWDQAMYDLYEVKEEDFSGAFEAWNATLHPDWRVGAVFDLEQALSREKDFNTLFGIKISNGVKYIAGTGEVIRNDHGEALEMYGVNWDRTNEYLEKTENEKNRAVIQQNLKLISIGELGAGIGHELNNPITIVNGYLNKLEKSLNSDNKSDIDRSSANHYIKIIKETLKRISSISNGLRSFSQIDHKEKINFSFDTLIDESISLLNEVYEAEGIELNYHSLPHNSTNIFANQGELHQVLMNVIGNARDSILERRLKNNEVTKNQKFKGIINLYLEKVGDFLELSVQDNGVGIPKENLSEVFNPFFTTKELGKGTGIGLSLCFKLIHHQDGEISITSSLKGNTVFKITLPISHKSKLENERELNKEGYKKNPHLQDNLLKLKGLKVLVVENESHLRLIASDLLEDMGCKVVTAGNGQIALARAKAQNFDLIITDIKMPIMDGVQFINALKENKLSQSANIICTTGSLNQTDKLKESFISVDAFLEKPYDKESFYKTLSTIYP